ncbi:MAG: two-component regulator propeller domain-containing protein [Bacteroidia bacterium]
MKSYHSSLVFTKVIVFVILVACSVNAQERYHFNSLNVDDGLAQNSVWDIKQDKYGYMWFATTDGLNRYDGVRMIHYKYRPNDSNSIAGNLIESLFIDDDGNLWVSHEKGISKFNKTKNSFDNIFIYDNVNNMMNYVHLVGEDRKNRIWCLVGVSKFFGIDKKTLKIVKQVETGVNGLFAISTSRNGVCIGDKIYGQLHYDATNVYCFDTKNESLKIFNGPSFKVGQFIKLNDSTICSFGNKKLICFNIKNHQYKFYDIKNYTGTEENYAITMLLYGEYILMGNDMGLYYINPKTLNVDKHLKSFTEKESEGFKYVQCLTTDKSGNLWIGTNGDGIKCLSKYRNKFKHLAFDGNETTLVKSIAADDEGNVYTGLYAQGMVVYTNDNKALQFRFGARSDKLTHILAITYFNNRIVFCQDRFIKILNPKTKHIEKQIAIPGYINEEYITYPHFVTYKGSLYFLTDNCIYLLDGFEKLKCEYAHNDKAIIFSAFEIINDTTWWIGYTQGVFILNPKSKKYKNLGINLYTKSICKTSQGEVWAGGNGGLYRFTNMGKLIKAYSVDDKLPSDFIYGILEDNNQNIWFSHNKGLTKFNVKENKFTHYKTRDGLQSNEFNTGAYYKDKNGLLYFGGVAGVNIIDPENIATNPFTPLVAVHEIQVNDQVYMPGISHNTINTIELDYLHNTISVDFAALEYSMPDANTYKYQLTGYDKDWVYSGTKHSVRYTNLPPGNYELKILAANGDGVWSNKAKVIHLTIIPPFWQQNWFYAIMLLLGFGLIALFIWFLLKRQKDKAKRELEIQQKLEMERIRISRDLHDHVGSQLSFLVSNIEWMWQHPEAYDKADESQKFKELSEAGKNALQTLRQTIWAMNNQHLTIEEFADRFKDFAKKHVGIDKRISISFNEEIQENHTLSPTQALNVFRICQEALSNALKHSGANKIMVEFFSSTSGEIEIKITDNGVGFDINNSHKKGHYGLQNMKARAAETNAKFNIISNNGHTEVSVKIHANEVLK